MNSLSPAKPTFEAKHSLLLSGAFFLSFYSFLSSLAVGFDLGIVARHVRASSVAYVIESADSDIELETTTG